MRTRLLLMGLLAVAGTGASGCPAPVAPARSAMPAELPSVAAASPKASPSPRPSPSHDPNTQKPFTFKGSSDLALVGPFRLVAGDRVFRCTYEGRGTISVFLIRHDGQQDAQLFNHQGAFSDAVHHTVSESADYHLQVAGADGPWRVEIE